MRWYRLCCDIDRHMGVKGFSIEIHDDDLPVEHVLVDPNFVGPFDTIPEVFQGMVQQITRRYGREQTLFD